MREMRIRASPSARKSLCVFDVGSGVTATISSMPLRSGLPLPAATSPGDGTGNQQAFGQYGFHDRGSYTNQRCGGRRFDSSLMHSAQQCVDNLGKGVVGRATDGIGFVLRALRLVQYVEDNGYDVFHVDRLKHN